MMYPFVVGTLVFLFSCITQDESGNTIKETTPAEQREQKRKAETKVWQLKEYNIDVAWSKDDLEIPIILASLPNKKIPRSFIIQGLPEAKNQGSQASGTAWATGYLAMSLIQRNQGNSDYLCSPAFIYNSLNKGLNQGITISETLVFLTKRGCPPFATMPYRADDFRIWPHTRAIDEARKYLARDYARVEFRDLDQVRAHLLQKRPIIISMLVSSNFKSLRNTVEWKNPIGVSKGRQTLAVIGYDDRTSHVWIQNSLGKKWGLAGQAKVSYSWFLRLTKKAFIIW